MRSRVTDGLTLKIEKNVKITEIDHNGACRRICEYFKTLFVPFLIDLSSDSSQKKYFKVSEKWRLFCFVLFCFVSATILTAIVILMKIMPIVVSVVICRRLNTKANFVARRSLQ